MILIGNKADLDHQRQVRRNFAFVKPVIYNYISEWLYLMKRSAVIKKAAEVDTLGFIEITLDKK